MSKVHQDRAGGPKGARKFASPPGSRTGSVKVVRDHLGTRDPLARAGCVQ